MRKIFFMIGMSALTSFIGCCAHQQSMTNKDLPERKSLPAEREQFFRLEKQDGRWWLITPHDERFVALGVVHVGAAYRGKDSLLQSRFRGDVENKRVHARNA